MPPTAILAIFYSEFHPSRGPVISYQSPEGFAGQCQGQSRSTSSVLLESGATQDFLLDFDSVSDYIIPKVELQNRLVSISTSNYKIVGYPVKIEHAKYPRNALLFNLCFVFARNAVTLAYDSVIRKFARVLQALEIESGFLSTESTKSALPGIIQQCLDDLNAYQECQIRISYLIFLLLDSSNTIDIKLFPNHQDPVTVFDHQVPVLTIDLQAVMGKHWDMTLIKVIPFCNGVNSVKKISMFSNVHLSFVRLAIQHLIWYGCANLVDIFQFSNIYCVRSGIAALSHDKALQDYCQKFVKKHDMEPPSLGDVFCLYASFKGGMKVSDWVRENNTLAIDVRKFIVFGIIKKIICRLHTYPILSRDGPVTGDMVRYLNGEHHLDELCTMFSCSLKQLDQLITSHVHYISK